MFTPHRIGLAFGGVLALWHLSWATLVGVGWGQKAVDWIFWLHFIDPPYRVGELVVARAAVLIVVTAALGYVGGAVLGWILNRVREV